MLDDTCYFEGWGCFCWKGTLRIAQVEKQQKRLIKMYKTQIQKLQEAAEMVKSRCENLLSENNLITKNKNKKLEKVSLPF